MSISRFSIRRPIFMTMVTLIFVIIGAIALFRLPIDLMPDVTNPTISIRTEYENASPEIVEQLVTRPIEEAVAAVPGAIEVTSTSSEGNSNVTVKFNWGTNLDAAASDVRDRIDRILDRLPDDIERPVLYKFDFASMPILYIGISSEMDPVEMRNLIEDNIKFRIESIPGVASMDIFGGREREISVDVDPYRLRAMGVSLELVMSILERANINRPAGYVDFGDYEITIRAPGEFVSVKEIRDTVIFVKDGVPVRVSDIADVVDGMNRVRRIARIDSQDGVRVSIMKQSGANTVAVAAMVVEEIERIREEYANLNVKIIMNTADYINNSINNVSSSAVIGGGLAVILVLVFLRNFLSTVVIALSIPVSIISTFAVLYWNGLTLNLMTLGGLALGVGMLVDNSIVVLENIYRIRDEEGLPPEAAAEKGADEVFAAIVASTLTTLVVFLPLTFIEGMAGLMFKEFALVVAFSLICSLAAAVMLVPMLAVRMMRMQDGRRQSSLAKRVFDASEAGFKRMENEYKLAIAWCLDHRFVTLAATFVILAGSLVLAGKIDVEMMPKTDEGYIIVNAEMDVGVRLDLMSERTRRLERLVREHVPEARAIISSIGGSSWRGVATHQASVNVRMGTREERAAAGLRSTEQVAASLRELFAGEVGFTNIRVSEGTSFLSRGMGGESEPVAVEVRGYDLDLSEAVANQILAILRGIPGIVDARITREGRVQEKDLHIDRQKAADLGLWVEDIANFLEISMAGKEAAQYRVAGKEYPIMVRFKDSEKMTIGELLGMSIVNADGRNVALRNVINEEDARGPTVIDRKNQQRITTVKASLSGRALGSAMEEVREAVRAIPMPSGFSLDFGTDYQDQQDMMTDLVGGFVLAIVLVYMIMACQFESLRYPFVVMFSVPLAAIGVLVILFLTNTTINLQSMIGCIMLGGVVVNNAIILVDYANLLQQRDGFSIRNALEEAGRRRLRPILMTAMSTILGLIPLALGWGDGGEAQAPMARVVVGGLFSSTLITLLIVPVVYSLVTKETEQADAAGKPALANTDDENGAGTA